MCRFLGGMRACGGIRQTFTTTSVLQELRNIPPKTQESAKTFFRDQWHYYQLVYVSLFSFHYYKLAVNIMQTFPAARYHFELAVIIIVQFVRQFQHPSWQCFCLQ